MPLEAVRNTDRTPLCDGTAGQAHQGMLETFKWYDTQLASSDDPARFAVLIHDWKASSGPGLHSPGQVAGIPATGRQAALGGGRAVPGTAYGHD